eukprot:TRINITY_DN35754_c0_g1_i1.p1 TRINITY_DN35754_c0_g1~~TRINITY_DN35754_c0_g1_i1.p1  ORF type:complete len:294 (-),score=38.94 TRINITY_DN35754_c0_g1_i1:202-1083(-)
MLRNSWRLLKDPLKPLIHLSSRNTVIVKRVYKPPLVQTHSKEPLEVPQHIIDKSVIHTDDDKYMVYEIEEKYQEQETTKVILLRNVDDYGVKGQIVNFPSLSVHRDLLLPGLAVYCTEENLAKHADIVIPEETQMNSSETARLLHNMWSKRTLSICMHTDNPWTIEPWHIKASLRKLKTWCKTEDIEIPGGQISGPNLSLENKEFVAILTVNKFEKIRLRCRIHHLATTPDKKIDLPSWTFRAAEPVWEHERQTLLDMNRVPPSWTQKHNKDLADEVDKYAQWKLDRQERLGM